MAPAKKNAAKKPATPKGVAPVSLDSFKCRKTLKVGTKSYEYFSLKDAEKNGLKNITRLPYSLKVLLENLLRYEDGRSVKKADIEAMAKWMTRRKSTKEIAFRPARVLMQDFTGVPAVVDLAAMRDGIVALGGDAQQINPLNPVDLVIDHSVMIDEFGNPRAFQMNVQLALRHLLNELRHGGTPLAGGGVMLCRGVRRRQPRAAVPYRSLQTQGATIRHRQRPQLPPVIASGRRFRRSSRAAAGRVAISRCRRGVRRLPRPLRGLAMTVSGRGLAMTVSGRGLVMTVSGRGRALTVSGRGLVMTVSGYRLAMTRQSCL